MELSSTFFRYMLPTLNGIELRLGVGDVYVESESSTALEAKSEKGVASLKGVLRVEVRECL